MTPPFQTQQYIQSNNYNSKEKNCPAFVHIQLLLWLNREFFFSYRSIRELNMERQNLSWNLKLIHLKNLLIWVGWVERGLWERKSQLLFSMETSKYSVSSLTNLKLLNNQCPPWFLWSFISDSHGILNFKAAKLLQNTFTHFCFCNLIVWLTGVPCLWF